MPGLLVGCETLRLRSGPARDADVALLPYAARCGRRLFLTNAETWAAGDVFVFKSSAKRSASAAYRLQQIAMAGNDAEWTHVGIYDGFGRIWDAMPGTNVRTRSIHDVFSEPGWLRARRLPNLRASRHEILSELIDLGEAVYDPWAYRDRYVARVSRLGPLASLEALTLALAPTDYDFVICSTFVSMVLRPFCDASILYGSILPLPADFLEDDFVEVPIDLEEVVFAGESR